MEAAARAGPAADPPQNPKVWTEEDDWHTERTLIFKAQQGLVSHPLLHQALEGQEPVTTLRALFKLCAQVLKEEVHGRWTDAAQALSELRLTGSTTKEILEYRKAFGKVALHLEPVLGAAALRQSFCNGCLQGSPKSWYRLLYETFADEKEWEGLCQRLLDHIYQAEELVEVYNRRPSRVSHQHKPSPTLRVNYLNAHPETTTWIADGQGGHHLIDQNEFQDEEQGGGDLHSDLQPGADNVEPGHHHLFHLSTEDLQLFHLTTDKLQKMSDALHSSCHICFQSGHFMGDCPHKDSPEISIPTELATILNETGRVFLKMKNRIRASGQGNRPGNRPWNKPL